MAFHELLPYQELDPIVPSIEPETPYKKPNNWVDDCVIFHGLR